MGVGATAGAQEATEETTTTTAAEPTTTSTESADGANDAKSDGDVSGQIVGGGFTSIANYPWMAAILTSAINSSNFDAQICGGTLIDPEWVLTAAHCQDFLSGGSFQVILGATALNGAARRSVSMVVPHPSYNSSTLVNDFLLLKLSVPATGIPTATYATDTSGEGLFAAAGVLGWGANDPNATVYNDFLKAAGMFVQAAPGAECPGWDPGAFDQTTMLCAGSSSTGGANATCLFDDGGPLVVGNPGGFRVIGVAIGGPFPCGQGAPDVFARVSAVDDTWITPTIGGAVPTQGTLHPMTPVRLVDTRFGTGALASGYVGPGWTINPQVEGWPGSGVPIDGSAVAVVLNVAVTSPSASGWLTIFPGGGSLPTAASMNFAAGQTVANGATVQLGQGGKISVNNTGGNPSAGFVHIIIDLVGWYENDLSGAFFSGLTPNRLVDTREPGGTTANPGLNMQVAGNSQITAKVCGSTPATGVNADASTVVVNVTVVAGASNGWVTVWDTGVAPNAASMNYTAGGVIANLVTVKVKQPDCTILIANSPGGSAAPIHIVVDVVGSFGPEGTDDGGEFHAIVPVRLVDTRSIANPSVGPIAPQGTITPQVRDIATVPDTAVAVILNTAVTGPSAYGWLTIHPTAPPPNAASLSFFAGQTIANQVMILVHTDDTVSVTNTFGSNSAGTAHVIMDANGYFM